MKMNAVVLVGALLLGSVAGFAEETRLAVADLKQEVRMPEPARAEMKPAQAPKRAQKKIARPAKHDTSLDWPQLG